MKPYVTLDHIIERAMVMLASHQLIQNPILVPLNSKGQPIRITQIRDYGGFDQNSTGVTISIYPYAYEGSSNETTRSNNTAIRYEEVNTGSAKRGFDKAICSVVVEITLKKVGFEKQDPAYTGAPVIMRNPGERALYSWASILHSILLTKPLQNLGGLIQNSTINWLSHRTPDWTANGGENAVFHKAALLWEFTFNVPRNWKDLPRSIEDPELDATVPAWVYVGVERFSSLPIYWDSFNRFLVSLDWMRIERTPKGDPVVFDELQSRFEKPDGTPLTTVELQDPRVTPLGPWIDQDLRIVGVMMPSRTNLFWNRVLLHLQLVDGTVVTQLEDGTPIAYDPISKRLVHGTTGEPIGPDTNVFLPITEGRINIYDAASLELRDTFQF